MKFGVRLLLLVALLLPLRTTMAVAGALCPPGSTGHAGASVAHAVHHHQHHHQDGGVGDTVPAHEAGIEHAPTVTLAVAEGPDAGTSCSVCSAVCAASPLLRALTTLVPSLPAHAERFPALDAPRPTSAYGAPERPPRSA